MVCQSEQNIKESTILQKDIGRPIKKPYNTRRNTGYATSMCFEKYFNKPLTILLPIPSNKIKAEFFSIRQDL